MQPNLKQPRTPYTRYPVYNLRQPSIIDMSLDKLVEQKIREAQYAQQQQAVAMRTPTVLTDPLLNFRVRDYYRQKYDRTVQAEIAGRVAGAAEGAALGAGIGAAIGALIGGIAATVVALIEPTPAGEGAASGVWAAAAPIIKAGFAGAATGSKYGRYAGAAAGAVGGAVYADYSTWYATKDMVSNLWSSGTVGGTALSTLSFVGRSMDLIGSATIVKSTLLSMITDNDLDELILNAYGLGNEGQVDVDFSQIREALNVDIGGIGNFIFDMFGELVTDPGNWKNVTNMIGNISHIGRAPFLNAKLKNIKNAVMDSTEKVFTSTNDKLAKSFYKAIELEDTTKMLQILESTDSPYLKSLTAQEKLDALGKYAKKINESAYKSVGAQIYGLFETFDEFDDFMTARLFDIASPIIGGMRGLKKISKIPLIQNRFDTIREFFKGTSTKFNNIVHESKIHTIESFKRMFYGEQYAEHTRFKDYLFDNRDESFFDADRATINKYKIKNVDDLLDKLEVDPTNSDLLTLKENYIKYLDKGYKDAISQTKTLETKYLELEKELNTFIKNNTTLTQKELNDLIEKIDSKTLSESEKKFIEKYKELSKNLNDTGIEYNRTIIQMEKYKTELDYVQNPYYKELKILRTEINNLRRIKRMSTQKGTLNIKSLNESLQKEFETSIQKIMDYAVSENDALRELTLSYLKTIGYNLSSFIKDNMSKAIKEQIDIFYNTKAGKYYEYVIKNSPKFMRSFIKNMIEQTEALHNKGILKPEHYDAINKYRLGKKQLKEVVDDLDEPQLNSLFNTLKKALEDKDFTSNLKEDARYSYVKIKSNTDKEWLKLRFFEDVMVDFGLGNLKLSDTSIKTSKDIWNKLPRYNFNITDHQIKKERIEFFEKTFELFNLMLGDSQQFEEAISVIQTLPSQSELDTQDIFKDYHEFMQHLFFVTPEGGRILRLNSQIYNIVKNLEANKYTYKQFKVVLAKLEESFNRIEKAKIAYKSKGNFARYETIYSKLKEYKKQIISYANAQTDDINIRKDLLKMYNELQALSSLDIIKFKNDTERLVDSLDKGIKKLYNEQERLVKELEYYNKKYANLPNQLNYYTTEINNELQTIKNQIEFVEKFQSQLGNTKQSFVPVFDYFKNSKNIQITPDYIISYSLFNSDNNLLDALINYIDELKNYSNDLRISNYAQNTKIKIRNMLVLGKEYAPETYRAVSDMFEKLLTDTSLPLQEQLVEMVNLLSNFNDISIEVTNLKTTGFIFNTEISYDAIAKTFKLNDNLSNYDPLNKLLHKLLKPNKKAYEFTTIDEAVKKFIEDISKAPKDKEPSPMEIFKQTDIDNYNLIQKIIGNTETATEQAVKLQEYLHTIDLDKKFVDLYENGNKTTAIIRKSSKYASYINTLTDEQKLLTNQPIILFDVETTGSTSNGVYSITYSVYNNGQWEKHVYFTKMQPDWEIDADVDVLNGGKGSTAKKIMEAKDTEQIFNTPQEMFEAVKNNINENSILVAHNARFDYSQIMNSLSGNTLFDANGQVSNDALEAFAKDNFDFTFIDSQKLLSLFFATGDNFNRLTNAEVFKQMPEFTTATSFTDRVGRTTYMINNKPVSEDEFLSIKDKAFVIEYDAKTNTTTSSYKGGDLHEASTDVAVMEAWTKVLLDNFKELKIELNDIDDSFSYDKKLMKKHLDSIRAGEVGQYNYQEHIDNILKVIDVRRVDYEQRINDLLSKIDDKGKMSPESSQMYAELESYDFVTRNLTELITLIQDADDYDKFFENLQKLEDFIQSNEDVLDIEVSIRETIRVDDIPIKEKLESKFSKEFNIQLPLAKRFLQYIPRNKKNLEVVTKSVSLKDYLQNFIDDLSVLDDSMSQKIKTFKQAYNGALVGHFQYNEIYVATNLANVLRNSESMNKFKEMFFKEATPETMLSTNEEILAKAISSKKELFLNVRKELSDIENNLNWYLKFMNNLDPKYYDIFKNIKQSLTEQRDNPANAEIARAKLHNSIIKKCKEDGLSTITAFELLSEIESNLDSFELPSAKTINRLYNTIRSDFTDYIQDTKFKYASSNSEEHRALVKEIDNIIIDIENMFRDLRTPLTEAKQMNRFYKRSPLTLAELNESSNLTKEYLSDLSDRQKEFKYIYDDLEGKFENDIHKLLPTEAIKYNSKVTFNYYKDVRSGMSLKRLINAVEYNNFVKEESKLYKALPIVDFEHSRLAQLYTMAANTGSFDIQDFIYSAKNSYALNVTKKTLNSKMNSMYNSLWDSLLTMDDSQLKALGLDPIAFKNFLAELGAINETTFSYLKDIKLTKQRLQNALVYNLYFKNSDILRKAEIEDYSDDISKVAMRNYMYADQIQKMNQFETSSFTFKDAIQAFTDENGELRVEQFQKYFRDHPEMTFVVFEPDNFMFGSESLGKYKQLNVQNMEVISQYLKYKDELPFSIMSVDSFRQLTKNQTYDLPVPLQWIQKYILGTVKRLGLALSFPFMVKNAVTASYMTMATTEAKFSLPNYLKHLWTAIADYRNYNHIYSKLITSITLNDFTHSYYEKEKNWVSLLNNPKFMEKLKSENKSLYDYINKLSPKQIERLAEYNDIVHTAAAYGQINEITRYHEREKQYEYNAKVAEERLKDTSGLSKDEIADLKYQVGIRKYQNMDIADIKKEYAELESKKILTYQEQQTMNLLKTIINRHNNKFWNSFQKYTSMIGLLSFNNNIETVLRTTAIRSYLEDGMTFDQATLKVIETQFTYDNKSIAEQLAEFVVPFVSYPLRMGSLMTDLTIDGTLIDVVFWSDYYLWDEEDNNTRKSDYLTRRRAQGDIPINNKLLSLGEPIKESLFMLKEPGYALNNKLNPLAKPVVDYISGSEYVRWNHIPIVSQTSNVINLLSTGKSSMINDYYKYNQYPNYYMPRINNRIGGTIYNKLYTRGGYSRVSMNMSNLTNNNLKHRVNAILRYSGPVNTRK